MLKHVKLRNEKMDKIVAYIYKNKRLSRRSQSLSMYMLLFLPPTLIWRFLRYPPFILILLYLTKDTKKYYHFFI